MLADKYKGLGVGGVAVLLAYASSAAGQMVTFKDGSFVGGEMVRDDSRVVLVQARLGLRVYGMRDAVRARRGRFHRGADHADFSGTARHPIAVPRRNDRAGMAPGPQRRTRSPSDTECVDVQVGTNLVQICDAVVREVNQ